MNLSDLPLNISNISHWSGTCDCASLCAKTLQNMFLPLMWNALLAFIIVIVMAVFYVRIPRDFRKDVIEHNPNFFLRHISDMILILLVSTGWLAGGVVVYVIAGG